ncbi:uncharacterized protein LOC144432031 [Styela clava]
MKNLFILLLCVCVLGLHGVSPCKKLISQFTDFSEKEKPSRENTVRISSGSKYERPVMKYQPPVKVIADQQGNTVEATGGQSITVIVIEFSGGGFVVGIVGFIVYKLMFKK